MRFNPEKDWCTNAPDSIPFLGSIKPFCHRHDVDYGFAGTELDRLEADYKLRRGIASLGRNQWLRQRWANLVASAYFKAVRRYGWIYYNYRTEEGRREAAELFKDKAISKTEVFVAGVLWGVNFAFGKGY